MPLAVVGYQDAHCKDVLTA